MAGALILAVRLSVFSYWGNSYWGGALPATGGALLLGGLVRLRKSPRVQRFPTHGTWNRYLGQ